MKKTISITIDEDLYELLVKESNEEYTSISALIRKVVKEYFKNKKLGTGCNE